MKDFDGVFALLQDIKDLLFGIFLLLTGGLLCLLGLLLGGWGFLLLVIGIFVCCCAVLYARRGYHRHEVEEKQD